MLYSNVSANVRRSLEDIVYQKAAINKGNTVLDSQKRNSTMKIFHGKELELAG